MRKPTWDTRWYLCRCDSLESTNIWISHDIGNGSPYRHYLWYGSNSFLRSPHYLLPSNLLISWSPIQTNRQDKQPRFKMYDQLNVELGSKSVNLTSGSNTEYVVVSVANFEQVSINGLSWSAFGDRSRLDHAALHRAGRKLRCFGQDKIVETRVHHSKHQACLFRHNG